MEAPWSGAPLTPWSMRYDSPTRHQRWSSRWRCHASLLIATPQGWRSFGETPGYCWAPSISLRVISGSARASLGPRGSFSRVTVRLRHRSTLERSLSGHCPAPIETSCGSAPGLYGKPTQPSENWYTPRLTSLGIRRGDHECRPESWPNPPCRQTTSGANGIRRVAKEEKRLWEAPYGKEEGPLASDPWSVALGLE